MGIFYIYYIILNTLYLPRLRYVFKMGTFVLYGEDYGIFRKYCGRKLKILTHRDKPHRLEPISQFINYF